MFTLCSDKRLPKADEMPLRCACSLGVVLPIEETRNASAACAIMALVIFIVGPGKTA
jgi:hypothetical protein